MRCRQLGYEVPPSLLDTDTELKLVIPQQAQAGSARSLPIKYLNNRTLISQISHAGCLPLLYRHNQLESFTVCPLRPPATDLASLVTPTRGTTPLFHLQGPAQIVLRLP